MDAIAFVERTLALLAFERDVDLAQTSLLASKCSPKLLQSKGLALLSLAPSSISVGLGGKTLVELQRSIRGMQLPAHTFRTGDTAEIVDESTVKSKDGNKKQQQQATDTTSLQGVVYKVHEDRIVVALNQKSGSTDDKDPEIPQKCTLCVVPAITQRSIFNRLMLFHSYLSDTDHPMPCFTTTDASSQIQ